MVIKASYHCEHSSSIINLHWDVTPEAVSVILGLVLFITRKKKYVSTKPLLKAEKKENATSTPLADQFLINNTNQSAAP